MYLKIPAIHEILNIYYQANSILFMYYINISTITR